MANGNPSLYIDQDFGKVLLDRKWSDGPFGEPLITVRKKARAVARRMTESFDVETDRGVMHGEAGDWLVTNHPEDDPGSDVWTISDERMQATYEIVG
jgi:hypothetical protein